ncbi:RNA recognition motif domain-containing protein [Ditylenchus destructor]|nr:RNA recognition motif domain-containing protein [Ditylenchus destructor]
MLSFFRPLRTYFNKFSNNCHNLCAISSTIPIQRNVSYEERRKLSLCKPLSAEFYSAHSKEKLLNATGCCHCTSHISQQSFSSRSESGRFSEPRTVMVARLSKDTTQDSLREYFSESWDVTDCRLIRDKETRNSLGYGFVEFATAEKAESVTKHRHVIDCKEVSVKMKGNKELVGKYDNFGGGRKQPVDSTVNSKSHTVGNKFVTVKHAGPNPRELTMFVGNLSPQTTDESIREHFSKYGQLTQSKVRTNSKTGQSRGFAYVSFSSKKELESARNHHPHTIDGVEVSFHSLKQDLVVDSLASDITEDSLRKFFSQYGQVQNCTMTTNSAGATTAFVILSNEDEVSRALADRPHCIDGKLVHTHQKGDEFSVHVGGFPSCTTAETLYETFSKVGKLVHWEVKYDWKNNLKRPLGYGFVSFSTAEEQLPLEKFAVKFDIHYESRPPECWPHT